jgi:glycosyltransferase involved in cell wall biosynthesis
VVAVVDTAGGRDGGTRRFRIELGRFLRSHPGAATQIGAQHHVTPAWLAQRELVAARTRPGRVIAANYVSFVLPRCERWVILGNALDFLRPEEDLPLRLSRRRQLQAHIVRTAARRADVVIAPTRAMAARVEDLAPALSRRVVVRPYPVSPGPPPTGPVDSDRLLWAVRPAAHKDVERQGRVLAKASAQVARRRPGFHTVVTLTPAELGEHGIVESETFRALGRLDQHELLEWLTRSAALVCPTWIESFNFPLADARVNRKPVVAFDSDLNREVAGDALVTFRPQDVDSLADAVERALETKLAPLATNPFEPSGYFRWLCGVDDDGP